MAFGFFKKSEKKVETPVKAKPSVPVNVQKKVGVKSDKQSKITNYEDIDAGRDAA